MKTERTIKNGIFLLMFLATTICFGQVETHFVQPNQTDPGYSSAEDSMAVSINTGAPLNKLYLFIGGTGSSSSRAYNGLRLHAANLGFDFINLGYPNTVPAASLANDNDSLAMNKYRQEICFGTPVSDAVTVDTFNSIFTRTLKLLQYLESTYPSENWGQYLASPNEINWSKIVVGGHSQGAGHAAYLAKQFLVDRVLMFSGPNDYSTRFSASANWLREPGVTPVDNHFVYLSLNDEVVDFSKQFINMAGLGMLVNDDSTHVDDLEPPYNDSHFLYTTQPPGIVILHHSSPIRLTAINSDVWAYMLTSPITTSTFNEQIHVDVSVFPNPVTNELYLKSPGTMMGKRYALRNVFGRTVLSGRIYGVYQYMIDVSGVGSGAYFLTIDNYTTTIIKK